MTMTMLPPIRILLLAVLYYLGIALPNNNCWSGYSYLCSALSIQHAPTTDSRRRFHLGCPHLTSSSSSSVDATTCRSFLNQHRLRWRKVVSNPINHLTRSMQRCDDDEHNNDAVEQQTRNLCSNNNIHATSFRDHLHSIALLASFRRLSFLFLSIMVVNFVRSTILKIPKSDKKMFDQCPWPFTLFHDPMKFIKDGATHVVVLWVGMCQLYSYWEKARRAIILP